MVAQMLRMRKGAGPATERSSVRVACVSAQDI